MKTHALAFAATLATAGTIVAHPVSAQETETRSIRVSFADLDLTQAAGRTTLEHRINGAVRRLCRMPSVSDTRAMDAYRACTRESWSGARLQLTGIYSRSQYAAGGPVTLAASK